MGNVNTIYFKLTALFVLALLPSAAFVEIVELRLRTTVQAEIRDVLNHDGAFASYLELSVARHARDVLEEIAEFSVRGPTLPPNVTIDGFLRQMLVRHPHFANFGIVGPDGTVEHSAVPPPAIANLSDRDYFVRALRDRRFSIGTLQRGRISGKAAVVFALPIVDGTDTVRNVVFAALDVEQPPDQFAYAWDVMRDRISAFLVVDADGGRIYQKLGTGAGGWSEDVLRPLVDVALKNPERVIQRQVPRVGILVVKATPVQGTFASGKLWMVLAVNVDSMFRAQYGFFSDDSWLFVMVVLTSLVGFWIGADFLVFRRVRTLTRLSDRVSADFLSLNAGPIVDGDEFGRLTQVLKLSAGRLAQSDSARHRIARQLEESESRYRTLFNSVYDIILVCEVAETGEPLRIVDANDVACPRLGYSRDELLSLAPSHIMIKYAPGAVPCALAAANGSPIETELVAKDGSRLPVEYTSQGLTLGNTRLVVSIFRDLAERKRAEQERLDAEDRIRHLQKMEAIGEMTGSICHDFNNLLTTIGGFAQLAHTAIPVGGEADRHLRRIEEQVARAGKLTKKLLTFSRGASFTPKRMILSETTSELCSMLSRLLRGGVTLTYHAPDGLWPVSGDADGLEQVLLNLILNARDAMPDGGVITVAVENHVVREVIPAVDTMIHPGSYVRLSVADTGTGMTPETQERIFHPFFTTKPRGSGTGLGLSVVYGVVMQHGAAIRVRSKIGTGTMFELYFRPIQTD